MRVQTLEHQNRKMSASIASADIEPRAPAQYLKLVSELFKSIECGACNSIIYKPEGEFDQRVLEANKNKHYVDSPNCKPRPS
jgi:hypothetical protein